MINIIKICACLFMVLTLMPFNEVNAQYYIRKNAPEATPPDNGEKTRSNIYIAPQNPPARQTAKKQTVKKKENKNAHDGPNRYPDLQPPKSVIKAPTCSEKEQQMVAAHNRYQDLYHAHMKEVAKTDDLQEIQNLQRKFNSNHIVKLFQTAYQDEAQNMALYNILMKCSAAESSPE